MAGVGGKEDIKRKRGRPRKEEKEAEQTGQIEKFLETKNCSFSVSFGKNKKIEHSPMRGDRKIGADEGEGATAMNNTSVDRKKIEETSTEKHSVAAINTDTRTKQDNTEETEKKRDASTIPSEFEQTHEEEKIPENDGTRVSDGKKAASEQVIQWTGNNDENMGRDESKIVKEIKKLQEALKDIKIENEIKEKKWEHLGETWRIERAEMKKEIEKLKQKEGEIESGKIIEECRKIIQSLRNEISEQKNEVMGLRAEMQAVSDLEANWVASEKGWGEKNNELVQRIQLVEEECKKLEKTYERNQNSNEVGDGRVTEETIEIQEEREERHDEIIQEEIENEENGENSLQVNNEEGTEEEKNEINNNNEDMKNREYLLQIPGAMTKQEYEWEKKSKKTEERI